MPPTYPFTKWRWRLKDELGRTFTSWHMTEAEALAKDQKAEKVPGTDMVIDGPLPPPTIYRTGTGMVDEE